MVGFCQLADGFAAAVGAFDLSRDFLLEFGDALFGTLEPAGVFDGGVGSVGEGYAAVGVESLGCVGVGECRHVFHAEVYAYCACVFLFLGGLGGGYVCFYEEGYVPAVGYLGYGEGLDCAAVADGAHHAAGVAVGADGSEVSEADVAVVVDGWGALFAAALHAFLGVLVGRLTAQVCGSVAAHSVRCVDGKRVAVGGAALELGCAHLVTGTLAGA